MLNIYQFIADPFKVSFGIDTAVWQVSAGIELSIPNNSFSVFVNVGPLMGDFEICLQGYEDE